MATSRIPVSPSIFQLVDRGLVFQANRFRELGSRQFSSPVVDDDLMNREPTDEELTAIEVEEAA